MATKLNGSLNRGRGYSFWVIQYQGMPALDVLITTIHEKRVPPFRIFIYYETRHRPHVHIGVSDDPHGAGFLLADGTICMGKCEKRQEKYMKLWIMRHQRELTTIWNDIQKGQDVTKRIALLNNYDEYFDDEMPEHLSIQDGYQIWYDGNMTSEIQDASKVFHSTGKMRIIRPKTSLTESHSSISDIMDVVIKNTK